jgi:hypothetical protein
VSFGGKRRPTIAASANQISGGVRNYDITLNAAMPARLPRMSTVYATTRFAMVSNATHHLPEPDERQRNQHEEHRCHGLDRHDERRWVGRSIELGSKEHLLRRSLTADVNLIHPPDPRRGRGDREGDREQCERKHGTNEMAAAPGGHQADRHPQKTRQQHLVREECQVPDCAREPANAR